MTDRFCSTDGTRMANESDRAKKQVAREGRKSWISFNLRGETQNEYALVVRDSSTGCVASIRSFGIYVYDSSCLLVNISKISRVTARMLVNIGDFSVEETSYSWDR